ncbi:MAG TPA: MFS transporter [Syntrophorhabdales bacterium]|nr:MFS transporter [Syntrophorhabdales bacterium]
MMVANRTSKRTSIYYGWYIVAASFLILFSNSGAMYTFGVVFKPIAAEFGWGRGPVSLVFFINMVVFALTIAVTGRLYDRHGPKQVILVCTTFVSVGLVLTSLITSFWQFLLFYGILVAVGFGGSSIPLVSAMTSTWFVKRRGLAVSLAVAGFSLGQFVIVPAFTCFAQRYGWRISYAAMGVAIFIVNFLLAFFVIKGGNPSAFGLTPFGSETDRGTRANVDTSRNAPARDLRPVEVLRTRSYWLFLFVMFACGCLDFVVTTHIVPFATDSGVSSATASNMLAWYGLLSLAGILIAGPAADKVGIKIPVALAFLLRLLFFLLILTHTSETSIYIFAIGNGFTALVTAPLNPLLIGRLYGMSHLGLLAGVVTTVHHFGGGFWAFAGGMIYDRTGSYRAVFWLSAGLAALAVLCAALIRERRHNTE